MIEQLMRERRSIREFSPQPLSRELISELVDVAVTAPSASNHQPWRFFVVDNKEKINAMADAVANAVNLIARRIEAEFENQFRNYGDYFVRFRQAPAVIVPTYRVMALLSNMSVNLDEAQQRQIRTMEFNSSIISTALAIQNLLLITHERGLGASCMTGPLVALDDLQSLLNIPPAWRMTCLIPVGYPAEQPQAKPRRPAESVIRWV